MTDTDILTAARAHWSRLQAQHIDVPEWGSDAAPCRVHFHPLTLKDRQTIANRSKGDDATATVLTVIRHALDEAGQRLFEDNAATRRTLETEVDPAVLCRIALAITASTEDDSLGE